MNSNEVLLFKDAIPDFNQPSTGKLTVTKNSSVQPVSLLRLGVFTPSCRTEATVTLNVTEALSSLEIAKQEGYTDIKITGPMLNYFQDFRCWTAIVHSFSVSPDALKGNRIKMPFSEFAKLCGYPSKRYSTKLRNEIADSLTKIRSKSIRFEKNPGITKFKVAGLLKEAEFDGESDYIILEADERLWDLYRSDHLTLLRKKPLELLTRNETAQALYTFFEALPQHPAPITFDRLRQRLLLNGRIAEQNRKMRTALDVLASIGYLKFYYLVDTSVPTIQITDRNLKLTGS
ncbi:RepB family plasmid replication initiator protein [Escherichia coli]